MGQLQCWAEIPDDRERESVVAWVKTSEFKSYLETGIRVSVTYEYDPKDPDSCSRKWGLINFFEHYPNHGIYNDTRKEVIRP